MANEYPFVAFRFDVRLLVDNARELGLTNPLCDAAFAECDGLEMTMEPKVVKEGGNNLQQLHLVGAVTYGNLTLKRGMTPNLDLWKWFAGVAGKAGKGAKASAVVRLLDPGSKPESEKVNVRFLLTGCLPIKLKAPALHAKDGMVAIEEMQIAYTAFTVE